ncbi:chaplin family protein [Kitasatospora sp. NPDC056184]|uniref:chaplin family protein n=1 Tax=Kitasatospora sp. NPDC056184 TaxID=3345738 RepID=UPI0035DB1CDC
MTNTRKYLIAAGLSAALAVLSAGPAFAGDCDEHEHHAPTASSHHEHQKPQEHQGHHAPEAPSHHGFPGGGGTTCINEGGASATGVVANSPGVLSGNQIQIPISIPINVCGNSLSIL